MLQWSMMIPGLPTLALAIAGGIVVLLSGKAWNNKSWKFLAVLAVVVVIASAFGGWKWEDSPVGF